MSTSNPFADLAAQTTPPPAPPAAAATPATTTESANPFGDLVGTPTPPRAVPAASDASLKYASPIERTETPSSNPFIDLVATPEDHPLAIPRPSAHTEVEDENEPIWSRAWGWLNHPLVHATDWKWENNFQDPGTVGKIERGVSEGAEQLIEGLTSPLNIGLTIGTLGSDIGLEALGIGAREIPAALKGVKTLIDLGFTGQQLWNMTANFPQMLSAMKDGDYEAASKLATGIAAGTIAIGLGSRALGKDAGNLATDLGLKKPISEQIKLAQKYGGTYDAAER